MIWLYCTAAVIGSLILAGMCVRFAISESGQRASGERPFCRSSPPRHAQTVTLPVTAALVPVAATAGDPPWESDTVVDASLCAAIRAAIDGCPSTDLMLDRYFSQVDLRKIFADQGLVYVPTGGAS